MTPSALYVEMLLRFAHMAGVIVVVGGLFFERIVFFPYADTQGERFVEVRRYARRHYRLPVWLALGSAALSGAILWYRLLPLGDARLNQVLGFKSGLFAVTVALVLLLTLRLRPLRNLRHKAPFILTLIVILGFILTFLGAYAGAHAEAARLRHAQQQTPAPSPQPGPAGLTPGPRK